MCQFSHFLNCIVQSTRIKILISIDFNFSFLESKNSVYLSLISQLKICSTHSAQFHLHIFFLVRLKTDCCAIVQLNSSFCSSILVHFIINNNTNNSTNFPNSTKQAITALIIQYAKIPKIFDQSIIWTLSWNSVFLSFSGSIFFFLF